MAVKGAVASYLDGEHRCGEEHAGAISHGHVEEDESHRGGPRLGQEEQAAAKGGEDPAGEEKPLVAKGLWKHRHGMDDWAIGFDTSVIQNF